MNQKIRRILGSILRSSLGRKTLIRLGRFLLDQGRLDFANRIQDNGELLVQACVVDNISRSGELVAIDVGANVGEWTRQLANLAASRGLRSSIHAFEPCPGTLETLRRNLNAWSLTNSVVCNRLAVS